jgi:hypothetical protein
MEHRTKPISAAAIPRSIEKAERYRMISQPWAAESICLDILAVEPANQRALHVLVLALTDQFSGESAELARQAHEALARITDPYERAYYAGVIAERRAGGKLRSGVPGAGFIAYEWLQEAMGHFAEAERLRPAGNDDALLRWNGCVRLIASRSDLRPGPEAARVEVLGE